MRVLMVLHAPPSPGELGPARRHRHLLRQLLRHHEVSVLSFGTPADRRRFDDEFGPRCPERVFVDMRRGRLADALVRLMCLLTYRSEFARLHRRRFQRALDRLFATYRYDLVLLSTTMLGCYRLPDGIPVIGDAHNVEHDNLRRAAAAAHTALRRCYYRVQAALTAREEARYASRLTASWATSPRDAALIRAMAPAVPVRVVPNGLDLERYRARRRPERATLLFVGLMSYYPNWHGVRWFLDEVLPLIEERLPEIRLQIVGANPPRSLSRAARPGVVVTGFVPTVAPYFESATAVVVPLAIGGGTRVKVLEALAYGVPVVSTTIGCEGLDVVDGETVVLADTPEAFAHAVLRVLQDQPLRARLSGRGVQHVRQYDWDLIGERVDEYVAEVLVRGSPAASGSAPVPLDRREVSL